VLYRADPLVLRDIWERVQARLAANPVSAKVNSWPLTQIVFCAAGEGPMYGSTAKYGVSTDAAPRASAHSPVAGPPRTCIRSGDRT